MRRLLIVLAILTLFAAGIYALFTFGGRKPVAPVVDPLEVTGSPDTASNPVTLMDPTLIEEPVAIPRLTALTSESVLDYWVNQLDAQAYYVTSEGVIKRADYAGNPTTLTSSPFDGGVDRVVSSPHGDAVIISSANPDNQEFKIYDLERSIWRALPVGTTAAAWSPVSPTNEVVFLSVGSLNIYNITKGTSRFVMDLTYYDFDIAWPTTNTIILSQRPSAGVNGSAWVIDLKQKTIQTALRELPGLWTSWQQGGALAFDTKNGSYLYNLPETSIRLPFLAIPSKCSQEGLWLFCAVPYAGVNKKQLPDSYLQGSARSSDNFVSLSLAGLPRFDAPLPIFSSEQNNISIDAWHLTKNGSYLYFINRYDQRLYSLKLVQ